MRVLDQKRFPRENEAQCVTLLKAVTEQSCWGGRSCWPCEQELIFFFLFLGTVRGDNLCWGEEERHVKGGCDLQQGSIPPLPLQACFP